MFLNDRVIRLQILTSTNHSFQHCVHVSGQFNLDTIQRVWKVSF